MKAQLGIALAVVGLAMPGLFVTGPTVKMVAADPGTTGTLKHVPSIVIKARDGRTAGQIVALKSNTDKISCLLATGYLVNPVASTSGNIQLSAGDAFGLCDAGTGGCYGGAVSCAAMTTGATVSYFTFDY